MYTLRNKVTTEIHFCSMRNTLYVPTVHSESIQTPSLFSHFVMLQIIFFPSSISTQYPIMTKQKQDLELANKLLESFRLSWVFHVMCSSISTQDLWSSPRVTIGFLVTSLTKALLPRLDWAASNITKCEKTKGF